MEYQFLIRRQNDYIKLLLELNLTLKYIILQSSHLSFDGKINNLYFYVQRHYDLLKEIYKINQEIDADLEQVVIIRESFEQSMEETLQTKVDWRHFQ